MTDRHALVLGALAELFIEHGRFISTAEVAERAGETVAYARTSLRNSGVVQHGPSASLHRPTPEYLRAMIISLRAEREVRCG